MFLVHFLFFVLFCWFVINNNILSFSIPSCYPDNVFVYVDVYIYIGLFGHMHMSYVPRRRHAWLPTVAREQLFFEAPTYDIVHSRHFRRGMEDSHLGGLHTWLHVCMCPEWLWLKNSLDMYIQIGHLLLLNILFFSTMCLLYTYVHYISLNISYSIIALCETKNRVRESIVCMSIYNTYVCVCG